MAVLSVLGNVAEKLPVLFVVPDVMLYTDQTTSEVKHEGRGGRGLAQRLETWGRCYCHFRTRR